MTIDHEIRDQKLQYDIKAVKMSTFIISYLIRTNCLRDK